MRASVCGWMGVVWASALCVAAAAAVAAPIEVRFATPPTDGSDESRSLRSIVKVRDIGEVYGTGGVYLISHVGDRQTLFQQENQRAIEQPMIGQSWRYCSVFAGGNDGQPILGRNWDNQNVGSIIVSLYRPAEGHASISFARSIDMGLPLNVRLDQCGDSELGQRLLLAPFHAMDGMNDSGLAVAVAGVKQRKVAAVPGRELVYVPYLIRLILDRAATVTEAVALVQGFVPFDVDPQALNSHLLVADPTGDSVVLEYEQGAWRVIRTDQPWQVMTNKQLSNTTDADLREACWRYRTLSEQLAAASSPLDHPSSLALLHAVEQIGTTWSSLYFLSERGVDFSVYQDWEKVYRLRGF